MNFRVFILILLAAILALPSIASAQADTVIGQFTSSAEESYAGGISGDGRFVVFESRGNLATENPRNSDFNTEIFLFDYAQRRIFQITDTKSVLIDPTALSTAANIKVEITNKRPVISNDGRWIAFASNATTSTAAMPNSTNPGSFDGNAFTPTTGANPLTLDGNMEMWLYQIPAYAPADLETGDELPLTNLSGGAFTQVTNTAASRVPQPATPGVSASVADDNHDVSISDDGSIIAFASTRNLVPATGNADVNDEIFTYVRLSSTLTQITSTPRGTAGDPIYNKNPTIAGDGSRVVFASTGDNPIVGMTNGNNPASSRNEEIFYANLIGGIPGPAATDKKQVTVTTPTTPGTPVNILDLGRRMSRNGRYIAFDSYAELGTTNANLASFALYLYDAMTDTFKRIGPRSDADAAVTGGDAAHYPGFTDYDANGNPSTLVLDTRLNIKADGTIPTTASEGLNPDPARPVQIYRYPIGLPDTSSTFTRLTKLPSPNVFRASTQPLPSNSSKRMAFNLGLTELGTGNFDFLSESYYLYVPDVVRSSPASIFLATGASRLPVSPTAVPSPSPTATPSPTPTPTPSPTPSGSPSPAPSPTPVTPPAVLGISPGMLAVLNYQGGQNQPIIARTAVGSISRVFNLPIELSGLTMTINGVAVGLKSVSSRTIVFVAPPALASVVTGTMYPIVINNQGLVIKGMVTIVPARPDIFTNLPEPGPGGRAQVSNVTNRVATGEPFTVTTIRIRGGRRVPTVLRLRLTGIANTTPAVITIRIGSTVITGTQVLTGGILVEPGVYTVDFTLPPGLNGAGDQPIVVEVNANGTIFSSRLEDTAPRLQIL